MNVREMLEMWERTARGELTTERYTIQLLVEDAARLQALAEMYPRRNVNELITDLISAALHELESGLPYVRGQTVVTTDEEGDPVYEDIGPTPRYLDLLQKYLADYRRALEPHADPDQAGLGAAR